MANWLLQKKQLILQRDFVCAVVSAWGLSPAKPKLPVARAADLLAYGLHLDLSEPVGFPGRNTDIKDSCSSITRTLLPPYNSSVSPGLKRSQQYSWVGTIWGERFEGNRAAHTGTQQELCRTTAAYWNEWEQSTPAHCLWSSFAGNLWECLWLLCALEHDTGQQRSSDCRLTFYATEEQESSQKSSR